MDLVLIEIILGSILLFLGFCYYYQKWLNKKFQDKGYREISIIDLIPIFMLNSVLTVIIFLLSLPIYILICTDLGLTNNGLYELNKYISLVPIKVPGYTDYQAPMLLFQQLNKMNFKPVIIGAVIIAQGCAYLIGNVLMKYNFISNFSYKYGLIAVFINSMLWFIIPFSITIFMVQYHLIYIAILRMSRIEIRIKNPKV